MENKETANIVTEGDSARKGKRIELTRFEGIEDRIKHCQEGNYPAEDLLQELALIAPNLITELKRMYEREDFLMEARKIWLIEERRLEKKVEASQKEMLQSFVRTSDTEKALRQFLSTIRDDLDEVMSKHPSRRNPAYSSEVKKEEFLKKIRNFANDASQMRQENE